MKFIPTFASIIALLWASAMTLRSERLPWIVPAYVVAQCVFALVAFLGLQRDILYTRAYSLGFLLVFSALVVFAVCFAYQQARLWVLACSLGCFGFLALDLHQRLAVRHAVPAQIKMSLVQGAVLLACGLVVLLSSVTPLSPEMRVACLALGSFWLALGAFAWSWSAGFFKDFKWWMQLNEFIPAMFAIVAFGWLALQLGKAQAELSYQALPDVAAMERAVRP